MKRTRSLPEIPPFKKFKVDTSCDSLVEVLKSPNILNTIIGYWFADRSNICPKCNQINDDDHVFDWLGFQVITAFYRTDHPPWKDFFIDSTVHETWCTTMCSRTLDSHVVFTQHQRMYLKSWECSTLLKHMCIIVDRFKLHNLKPMFCGNLLESKHGCGEATGWRACRNETWGLLYFAITKMNLPLTRRILDLSIHGGLKFAQIIKMAESQNSPDSKEPYPFLHAYIPQTIRFTKHMFKTFKSLRDCMREIDPSDGFFYKALVITFEERGLDLHFWVTFPQLALEEDSDGEY